MASHTVVPVTMCECDGVSLSDVKAAFLPISYQDKNGIMQMK